MKLAISVNIMVAVIIGMSSITPAVANRDTAPITDSLTANPA